MKVEQLDEEDKTEEFLASFIKDAETKTELIDKKIKEIDERYKEVITFMGDTPKDMPMDTFLDIFVKFNKDVTVNFILILFSYIN
jgi:hypothetical protein